MKQNLTLSPILPGASQLQLSELLTITPPGNASRLRLTSDAGATLDGELVYAPWAWTRGAVSESGGRPIGTLSLTVSDLDVTIAGQAMAWTNRYAVWNNSLSGCHYSDGYLYSWQGNVGLLRMEISTGQISTFVASGVDRVESITSDDASVYVLRGQPQTDANAVFRYSKIDGSLMVCFGAPRNNYCSSIAFLDGHLYGAQFTPAWNTYEPCHVYKWMPDGTLLYERNEKSTYMSRSLVVRDGTLYGLTADTGRVYTVDLETGATTTVFTLGAGHTTWPWVSMVFWGASLYIAEQNYLYRVDPLTGAKTAIDAPAGLDLDELTASDSHLYACCYNGIYDLGLVDAPFTARLSQLCQAGELDGGTVELAEHYGIEGQTGAATVTESVIASSQVKDGRIEMELRDQAHTAGVSVPRRSCRPLCSHQLGDARCGVDLSLPEWTKETEALAPATGDVVQVADVAYTFTVPIPWPGSTSLTLAVRDFPALLEGGTLRLLGGQNAGLERVIAAVEAVEGGGVRLSLGRPLPFPVAVGDSAQVVRGCAKTGEVCANNPSFAGCAYMPEKEDAG